MQLLLLQFDDVGTGFKVSSRWPGAFLPSRHVDPYQEDIVRAEGPGPCLVFYNVKGWLKVHIRPPRLTLLQVTSDFSSWVLGRVYIDIGTPLSDCDNQF